jgi:hypothetical protein
MPDMQRSDANFLEQSWFIRQQTQQEIDPADQLAHAPAPPRPHHRRDEMNARAVPARSSKPLQQPAGKSPRIDGDDGIRAALPDIGDRFAQASQNLRNPRHHFG